MITQLFQPEPNHLKGLTFAKELQKLGNDIEVLTGFPNYPGGCVYKGYKQKWRMNEIVDRISILRVPLFPDHSKSGLRRFLCYMSQALTMCCPGIFLVRKPDVAHVYQGPATLTLPAILLRLFHGVPYILDVQDIWPDSVMSSGMLKVKSARFLLNSWCKLTYKLASKIVVLSPGYKILLIERGVPESKIEVVYNWCDESQMQNSDESIPEQDSHGLAGRFNIIYAGNLGPVQALDTILDAAGLIQEKHPVVQFIFIGDGIDRKRLEQLVISQNIKNVKFIDRQPIDKIGSFLAKADALLIHLRDDPLCRVGIPQKTQAYLAAGRPVIMAVRGDASELVKQANAGIVCSPQDADSLAKAVEDLLQQSPEQRNAMGLSGRVFYEKYLSFQVGLSRMYKIFAGVTK